MIKKIKNNKKSGIIIIQTMVFAAIVVLIIGALSGWTATTVKAQRIAFNREQAFQSSEAGIDYYRWHLAHAPTDYKDGTGVAGPYVHSLKNRNGDTVGQFSLDITAPLLGSTLVKINSTGSSALDSSFIRKITTIVAKPSIAKFAFAGHDAMRFGIGTEIFGPVHVNGGVRLDGLTHNIMTSGVTTYNDPDHSGGNEIGVHTHIRVPPAVGIDDTFQAAESDPNSIPLRPDVFEAGRLISQPTIDFSAFTTSLNTLKNDAQPGNGGFYKGASGDKGYHIVLKTNDTFDLYKINTWAGLTGSGSNCTTQAPNTSSWSVSAQTPAVPLNYNLPANGIIFIEDHVVVEGTINGARLTIVAATLPIPADPDDYKNIIINNDLSYTNYDGTDAIGLIGQGGVMVGMKSDKDLKIDGALIAQNNKVGRFKYSGPGNSCKYEQLDTVTLFGMIASYARYAFRYDGGGSDYSGYDERFITYDANLLYNPPPDFPLTSDQYQILSWQEVK